jgi:hypothetical protein
MPIADREARMRNPAAFVAALAIAGTGLAAPASADKPSAGCPPPFELQPISAFGPGFQDFLVTHIDKNADQLVCTQPLPDALPFPNINFVDNVVGQ